jgi:osmotically-inducible protein OsmY
VNIPEGSVDMGMLTLRGIVRDQKQEKRVEEISRELAGNSPIKVKLHYRIE